MCRATAGECLHVNEQAPHICGRSTMHLGFHRCARCGDDWVDPPPPPDPETLLAGTLDIPPNALLVSVITVVTYLADDGHEIDSVQAVDSDGEQVPLRKILGSLRLAEDTFIREAMGED